MQLQEGEVVSKAETYMMCQGDSWRVARCAIWCNLMLILVQFKINVQLYNMRGEKRLTCCARVRAGGLRGVQSFTVTCAAGRKVGSKYTLYTKLVPGSTSVLGV